MVIDMHTHMVPAEFPDMSYRTGDNRWPQMASKDRDAKVVLIEGKPFRTITASSWDADVRLADMDAEGVGAQVISPMPVLLSYWFEPKDTLEFGKFINTAIAELVEKDKTRFYGLGMVPLQDPKLAAKEVRAIKEEYGLLGVEIGSNVNGRVIGDSYFWPFFEAAAAERVAILIHPLQPVGADRIVGPKALQNLINFPLETALAAASLITGGVLERFPDLRIAVSHGGGSLFSVLPRLMRGLTAFEDVKALFSHAPTELARRLYYDTLVYDELNLNHIIDLFGSDRLMVGSDYPFAIREYEPGHALVKLALADEERQRIQHKNCLSFLGLNGVK
ncbi:amidohydrolase family protein [Kyrpidia sp.]|uniref:amidohydrolase family protein n=1 Tax=Kyrpidia sp. TaxID=2073077 RepID=UPI0025880BF8|nr:amidohydrolase family protein [Kyrpidia sp.]MCL6576715.1 amidohydrolase [Kyrpidia sp.]